MSPVGQMHSVAIGVFAIASYLRAADGPPCPASGRLTIAVVDSAVDARHPSLRGLVAEQEGQRFLRRRSDDRSISAGSALSHGTAMALVATRAAASGGAISVLPLTIATDSAVDVRAVADAIDYAGTSHGRVVVNLSMGTMGVGVPPAIASAIERHTDILFVVAAGNQGRDTHTVTASLCHSRSPTVLCVAAIDRDGVLAGAPKPSNFGADVDFAAVGVDVELPGRDGHVSLDSGTSLAAAYVSGVAARVWSAAPGLPATQIAEILCESSTLSNVLYSRVRCGIIDPGRAARSAARTCSLAEAT